MFRQKRHSSLSLQSPDSNNSKDWRMRSRLKTVSVSLVLCLNIGIDPPDVIKTQPCAKLECWIDPFSLPPQKALEAIGRNLQLQYETWQPRARYRLSLDPSIDETKKLCCSLRRNAKDERILFHYNGHGVPRPTEGGEIWIFNKNYTQYIPVSVYDIQSWLGSPCIYVYDCNNAANILLAFNKFASQRDAEALAQTSNIQEQHAPYIPLAECIQLAACKSSEFLPMNPDLPADIFTCCLTTPIEIALRWFITLNPLLKVVTKEMITKIPGKLNDRRTPLGELNWIFTAITDSIAWNTLSHNLFQKLFRQDLMVAALFRNFLLGERIMRHFNCHPMSSPALPNTYHHPMWQAWDLAVDGCLTQLPALLASEDKSGPHYEYIHSSFFAEQLTAFEVGLPKVRISKKAPEQLPVVLQVLLSQVHRLRALLLLGKFLDLGAWAVNHALSVGIFPYVLKLLQSPATELKPVLIFIWCKILAVDRTCQSDLFKDNGFTYFIGVLMPENELSLQALPNISQHRAMCAFILSVFCNGFPAGQACCLKGDLLPSLLPHLSDPNPLLRQWVCLCLGSFWNSNMDIKLFIFQESIHLALYPLVQDPVPEVRSAALFAFSTLLGTLEKSEYIINFENGIVISALKTHLDASPLVRKELVVFLSKFVSEYTIKILSAATDLLEEDKKFSAKSSKRNINSLVENESPHTWSEAPRNKSNSPSLSIYGCVWKTLLNLSVDPHYSVSIVAEQVVDKIISKVLGGSNIEGAMATLTINQSNQLASAILRPASSLQNLPDYENEKILKEKQSTSAVGRISNTLRRSASLAFSLFGTPPSKSESDSLNRNNSKSAKSLNRESRDISFEPAEMMSDASYRTEERMNLYSEFFNWSCDYFIEPQMRPPSIEDPGTQDYNEAMWRKNRNETIDLEITKIYEQEIKTIQEPMILLYEEVHPPVKISFHEYEPYLVCADPFNRICIYNWNLGAKIYTMMNPNPYGSRISGLSFIDERNSSLLMVASDDGVIRLYKDYDKLNKSHMVTSFKALLDFKTVMPPKGMGVICQWDQTKHSFIAGGNSKTICVWDADKEMCTMEIPTKSSVNITSINIKDALIVCGYQDGQVKIHDLRLPSKESIVNEFSEQTKQILKAQFISEESRLISGSSEGTVLIYDIRKSESVSKINSGIEGEMTGFDVHSKAPLIACGDNTLNIKVHNIQNGSCSSIKYSEGYLSPRAGTVGVLSFHATRLIMAASSTTSSSISLFKHH